MRNALVIAVVLAAALVGCGKSEVAPPAAAATAVPISEEAHLAAADLADGTEDHVVSKCAVCNLSMDGTPELTSTYAGYTFHHCSAHCKETFDHDPAKVLARVKPAV
jgi:YHS domain-containing protein